MTKALMIENLIFKFDNSPKLLGNQFGSREHYFHFLIGYLLPALYEACLNEQFNCFLFEDCGPSMNPIIEEACALLGITGHISECLLTRKEDNNCKTHQIVKRWDYWLMQRLISSKKSEPWTNRSLSPYEESYGYELTSIVNRLLKVLLLDKIEPKQHHWLLLQRSPETAYYHNDGRAEIPTYGAGRRAIKSPVELCDSLIRQGLAVKLFEPGAHSLARQIRTFREAYGIIGIRGAEFANMVWMRPGCAAIMLETPINKENNCARSLAKLLDIQFTGIPVTSNYPLVDKNCILNAVADISYDLH